MLYRWINNDLAEAWPLEMLPLLALLSWKALNVSHSQFPYWKNGDSDALLWKLTEDWSEISGFDIWKLHKRQLLPSSTLPPPSLFLLLSQWSMIQMEQMLRGIPLKRGRRGAGQEEKENNHSHCSSVNGSDAGLWMQMTHTITSRSMASMRLQKGFLISWNLILMA